MEYINTDLQENFYKSYIWSDMLIEKNMGGLSLDLGPKCPPYKKQNNIKYCFYFIYKDQEANTPGGLFGGLLQMVSP